MFICNLRRLPYSSIFRLNFINKTPEDEIQIKCNCIDVSMLKATIESKHLISSLSKLPGYKIFCKSETNHGAKKNDSVLKNITFSVNYNEEYGVDINVETLTFRLILLKN